MKKLFKALKYLSLWLFVLLLASACQKINSTQASPSGSYANGVWVIDEGNFTYGNAGLDFYHKDKDTLEKNVFENVNGHPLGDVLQSVVHYNGQYFMTLNNSGDIVVADDKNIKLTAVINGLTLPRYMLPLSPQKAYVTSNTAEAIYIINPSTYQITGKIPYDPKPNPDSAWASWTEQMVLYNGNVYTAAAKTGKLLVINSQTDKITDTISLAIGAKNVALDNENKIWVLCDGTLATPFAHSWLFRIDPATFKIMDQYSMPDVNTGAGNMQINAMGDTLYYVYGGIYKLGIHQNSLPAAPLISGTGHDFYGLGIDPANGTIYAGDALGFSQNGIVFQYSPAGKLEKTHQCGVGPNGFLFTK